MLELIITSSILILVVIALRFLFGNKISRRLRYAMWGVVLLRLIIPIQFFPSPISIMNVVGDGLPSFIQSARTEMSRVDGIEPMNIDLMLQPSTDANIPEANNIYEEGGLRVGSGAEAERTESPLLSNQSILFLVWLIGAVTVALWFVLTNLRLYKDLRTYRRRINIKGSRLPVYFVDELLSPCLFGIIKPAIYLTPQSMESQNSIDHVMTHELAHYIQKDHLWAVMRGICLSVYWFNPLVWIAAWLSRSDCELSCDEAAVIGMGDETRIDYGRTLVRMISVRRKPDTVLCAATTMSSGATKIKKRLEMIINNKKTAVSALLVTFILLAVAACATFTSALTSDYDSPPDTETLTGDNALPSDEDYAKPGESVGMAEPIENDSDFGSDIDDSANQDGVYTLEQFQAALEGVFMIGYWGEGAGPREVISFERVERDRDYIIFEGSGERIDLTNSERYRVEIRFRQSLEDFNAWAGGIPEESSPFRHDGEYGILTDYFYIVDNNGVPELAFVFC